jgi:putative glutamine transport system substrate-binding protein
MPDFKIPVLLFPFILLMLSGCERNSRSGPESGSWAETLQNGSGQLTAFYVPAEGFAWHNGDRLTGVTVDILGEFTTWAEDQYGVQVGLDFRAVDDFRTFMQTVVEADEGTIGFANVTITEERKKIMQFSPPYMNNIAVLISHDSRAGLDRFENFRQVFSGLTALAFEGTLHETRLRKLLDEWYPEMPVEYAHSNPEIIEKTASGDTYLAYVDVYNYWRSLGDGAPLKRHEIGDEAAEQFGYILPLKSDWGPVLQEFFEHDGGFIHSAAYRSILEEHLGAGLAALLLP